MPLVGHVSRGRHRPRLWSGLWAAGRGSAVRRPVLLRPNAPRRQGAAGCAAASSRDETLPHVSGCEVAGAAPTAPASGRRCVARQAWNSARLIAAALVKMRIPRTTTTAVASCEPTPIWSPT